MQRQSARTACTRCTCMPANAPLYAHTTSCTRVPNRHMHKHMRTNMLRKRAHTAHMQLTRMRMRKYARAYTKTHTNTRTHTRTHTHARTHMHTCACTPTCKGSARTEHARNSTVHVRTRLQTHTHLSNICTCTWYMQCSITRVAHAHKTQGQRAHNVQLTRVCGCAFACAHKQHMTCICRPPCRQAHACRRAHT
jgi:hypothetical protein